MILFAIYGFQIGCGGEEKAEYRGKQGKKNYATSMSFGVIAESANWAFTLTTVFSTVKPYLRRSSSWVVACSMNWSGQPMRTTGVDTPFSLNSSSTAEP